MDVTYAKAVTEGKMDDWSKVEEYIPDKKNKKDTNNDKQIQNCIKELTDLLVTVFKSCQDSTSDITCNKLRDKFNSICNDIKKNNNLYKNEYHIVFNDNIRHHITLKINKDFYGHIIGKKGAFINFLKSNYNNTEITVPLANDPLDKHIEIKGENACNVASIMLERILKC